MHNFTIIIPHYNTPAYLRELLNSIPRCDNIQVIVIDDNSTEDIDDYECIRNEYHNVEFYRNDSGFMGPGAARNIGLQVADGEWILFADADDYFAPDFYDTLMKHVDDKEDVIFFKSDSYDRVTNTKGVRHLRWNMLIDNYLLKRKNGEFDLRYNMGDPWAKMFRRSFLNEYKIKMRNTLKGDLSTFMPSVSVYARTIAAYDETIYVITDWPGSLTRTNHAISEVMFDELCETVIETAKFYKQHLSHDKFRKLHQIWIKPVIKAKRFGLKKSLSVIRKFLNYGIPLVDIFFPSPAIVCQRLLFINESNKIRHLNKK